MLADTWMCTIAYDSTRVMLYYLTQILDSRQEQTKLLLRDTIPLLHSNVKALRLMIPMFATAEQCVRKFLNFRLVYLWRSTDIL